MSVQSDKANWIFYITKNEGLPKFYYSLASQLSKKNLMLIPVTLDQFIMIVRNHAHAHVVMGTVSIPEKQWFEKSIRHRFLRMIKNRRITFYHLSSFNSLELNSELGRNDEYYYLQLPLKIDKFVDLLEEQYFKKSSSMQKWIWGKRAKLPSSEM
jgi:hypothetical protein